MGGVEPRCEWHDTKASCNMDGVRVRLDGHVAVLCTAGAGVVQQRSSQQCGSTLW